MFTDSVVEACPLKSADLKSLDYIVVGAFMNFFKLAGGRYMLHGDVQLSTVVCFC